MKRLCRYLLFGLCGLGAGSALADPIGGPDNINCAPDNCFGSLITLNYKEITPTEYQLLLTIDTSSYTGADTNWIQAVAIKPANALTGGSLVTTTAPGGWNFALGGLSSGSCDGSGSGFECAFDGTSAVTDGSTYKWVFDATVASASDWLLTPLAASVKVNYDSLSPPGTEGLLTSAQISLQPGGTFPPQQIPEPATLALLGLGLFGLGVARRRRT